MRNQAQSPSKSPKTIYLEHSALVHERWWVDLTKAFEQSSARLVMSDWNLIEIANGGDRAQALRRAALLETLRPLWMIERVEVEKREVKNFVFKRFFQVPADPIYPFTPSLSAMLSCTAGSRVELNETPTGWIRRIVEDPQYLKDINTEKAKIVPALLTLQNATTKTKAGHEPTIFREWLTALIPFQNPEGKLLTRDEIRRIADFCYLHRADFYAECPAMAVEDALYQVRTRDPRRIPEEQDAIDFQHSVMALSYCDCLLSRDKHLVHIANEAGKVLPRGRIAKTARRLSDLTKFIVTS